ncbi:MAG: T9SS type A sorting domain-containing protein, partial [Bacteroidales bacterium]
FAGGAGGGNRGGGGIGGYPSDACGNNDPFNLAMGGFIDADLYTNVTELKNRIYFGGGGGAGNEGEGRTGTPGGNGGGIIILVTDTLESQSVSLLAAGESVTGIATAGAGGAGGGGVIVIDANVITGCLDMDVSGGDGGHTNYATDMSGPGGLGGGGVIWHNGSSLSGCVTTDYSPGSRGLWNNSNSYGTSAMGIFSGAVIDNLIIPIRGFTFNVTSDEQTICQGDTPDPIIASKPKGDVSFQYEWLVRTNSTGWAPAPAPNNEKDYAPGPLFDTTYYKRVVTPTDTLNRDTSGVVSIYVHDTISNNVISPDDIICWDVQPDTMTGTDPGGGDRLFYYYLWENRTGTGGWTSSQDDTLAGYRYPAGLQETTYFRRKVTSGACTHYSDSLTIEVLDTICGSQSQTFAPNGATWYYTETFAFSGDINYIKIESVGDTIINEKHCKILMKNRIQGCSNRPYIEFFHMNDSGEIFFYDSSLDAFQKLYDFNAEIGDNWTIKLTWDHGSVVEIVDSVTYSVDSISLTNINDKTLKVFHTIIEFHDGPFEFSHGSKYIENIGDMGYFFPWNLGFCDDNIAYGLRCYEDSIIGLYSTGLTDSCDYTYKWTNIDNEMASKSGLLIFPNPATNYVYIRVNDISKFLYEVLDQSGRIILEGVSNGSEIKINISGLGPGLYFVRVRNSKNVLKTGKLMRLDAS